MTKTEWVINYRLEKMLDDANMICLKYPYKGDCEKCPLCTDLLLDQKGAPCILRLLANNKRLFEEE